MPLNHIHFGSTDPQPTIDFYQRHFGFKVFRKIGNTTVLKDDEQFIMAIDKLSIPSPVSSHFHFGFCLHSADRVRALHIELSKKRIEGLTSLIDLNRRGLQFYFRDPSQNHVEVGWFLGWINDGQP